MGWKVEEENNHKALSRQWRITLQHNMGNDNSNLNGHKNNDENKNRMAITAVAEMMKITGSQMKKLRDTVIKQIDSSFSPSRKQGQRNMGVCSISRSDFQKAMLQTAIVSLDYDILDNLFTMWMKKGDDCNKGGGVGDSNSDSDSHDGQHIISDVFLFIASCSLLSSSSLDVCARLRFSFFLYDVNGTGVIERDEVAILLTGINTNASYFGDVVITPRQVEEAVEEAFDGRKTLSYVDEDERLGESEGGGSRVGGNHNSGEVGLLRKISTHPSVLKFVAGAGSVRYGTENLTHEL